MSVFTLKQISDLLPHRYPFLFIDRVVEFQPGEKISALKNVSINEPFFRGHFPDLPIMPGVLICEALAQAAAIIAHDILRGEAGKRVAVLTGIDNARFRRPVIPGDQLRLDVSLTRRRAPLWKFHARASVAEQAVADVDLLLTETPWVEL
jgi:3-hydroxyacyl-[acyl-carrier-protein] dehydratase